MFVERLCRARELKNAEIAFHQVLNRAAFDFGLNTVRLERAQAVPSYCTPLPKSSTRKRLGVILDRAHVVLALLEPLATTVAMTASVPAMIPSESRIGRIHLTLRVLLNDIPGRETRRDVELPLVDLRQLADS